MNKTSIAFVILGILFAVSALFCEPTRDDYQIWEHVIEMMDPSALHVLVDHTSCCMESGDNDKLSPGDFDNLKSDVPELSLETTADFVLRNQRQFPIGNLFTLPNRYTFL